MRPSHTAVFAATAIALAGCPTAGDDDDAPSPTPTATPTPAPLAETLGVYNLTRSTVQGQTGAAWVDFSGVLGDWAAIDLTTWSPAAYLATFALGPEVAQWRWDLGAWPWPEEPGLVSPLDWYPWVPADASYWDPGARVGLGPYQCSGVTLDAVRGCIVDDPLLPGGAAWVPGGALRWENAGGEDVVAFAFDGVVLPGAASLSPPPAEHPAAWPLDVTWTAEQDGADVTLSLVRDQGVLWAARVDDDGAATIPAEAFAAFGAGALEVVLGRQRELALPHPQGTLLLRVRDEVRGAVDLLPDVLLDPPFALPGQTLDVDARWFVGAFDPGTTADFGEGITVAAITPDTVDPFRATLRLTVAADAAPGARDVALQSGVDGSLMPSGFAVLDLLPQDGCADADADLPDGSYHSTTAGLGNGLSADYACLDWSLNGADAVYRVDLRAGEVLLASVGDTGEGDPALLLLEACGDPASAVVCEDVGYSGEPESLLFEAPEDGTWFLVVDGYHFGGGGTSPTFPFRLDVARWRPAMSPAWLVPGQTGAFTLVGDAAWDAGTVAADVSIAPGVSVDAVQVDGDTLRLTLAAEGDAAAGPRDVVVEQGSGPASFVDGLFVTDWPAWTCAEAAGAEAIGPGSGDGYVPRLRGDVDVWTCLDYPSIGAEVALPLDLQAGDLLDVTAASALDAQLVIVDACAPDACFADAAIDATVDGEPEALIGWPVPASGRYLLLLDTFYAPADPGAWSYTLEIGVR